MGNRNNPPNCTNPFGQPPEPQNPRGEATTLPASCYWVSQGACTLGTLPEDWVFKFLAQSPKARVDLLRCAQNGVCGEIDERHIEFAQKNMRKIDDLEAADRWQRASNQYRDNHRHIHQGQVYRENPDNDKGNDED